MKYVLIIALSILVVVVAGRAAYPFAYDDSIPARIQFGRPCQKEEARLAGSGLIEKYVTGCYTGAGDMLSGHSLHLFPGGDVIATGWADIAPEYPIGKGRWAVKGDTVRISWDRSSFTDPTEWKHFVESAGMCEEMELYFTFSERVTKHVVLLSTEKRASEVRGFLLKVRDYYDWQKIRKGLSEGNEANQPPLQTPASGTPAAGAPVAPPSGAAGR